MVGGVWGGTRTCRRLRGCGGEWGLEGGEWGRFVVVAGNLAEEEGKLALGKLACVGAEESDDID